MFCFVADLM